MKQYNVPTNFSVFYSFLWGPQYNNLLHFGAFFWVVIEVDNEEVVVYNEKLKKNMELKISDVDDSGNILFPMLLHGWIRFSPIVSLLHLISYTFIIQYVYKFRCCFLELRNGTELWATCWRFYTCLSQGVYIASQSDLVCLHYIVCSYNIGNACYVMCQQWLLYSPIVNF